MLVQCFYVEAVIKDSRRISGSIPPGFLLKKATDGFAEKLAEHRGRQHV